MIESIFGCLERIEEKLDKQPVQTEQNKSEDNGNMAEVLEAMAASQEQGHKRLEALWAVLKTISDRHCQQFVINYEDSIRRRHQMEMAAQQREQEGQRLMRESDSIKKAIRK